MNLPPNKITTIEELYKYFNVKAISKFRDMLTKKGFVGTKWYKKNKHICPSFKCYKLNGSALAMSSSIPGYSGFLSLMASELILKFQGEKPDYVLGLAQGGIPIAGSISLIFEVTLLVTRWLSKAHYKLPIHLYVRK